MCVNGWVATVPGNRGKRQNPQPRTRSPGGRGQPLLQRVPHECDGVTGEVGCRAAIRRPLHRRV